MEPLSLQNQPYELLGQMERDTPPQGLPNEEPTDTRQALTTAYITTLYYSALANLHLQSILPATLDELDGEKPRVKVGLNRSYADFTAAKQWLGNNGAEFIASSTAKHYYDEVSGMEENTVKDADSFYNNQ